MPFTISLAEYRMFHPDTAEFPTLSQRGLLAALLEKRRCKVARLARREAKRQVRRQAVYAWLGRRWASLRPTVSHADGPASASVKRNG